MTSSSGLEQGYQHWTQQGAYFLQPERKLLRISGPDAVDFLHRMTTNHIKPLAVGAVQETSVLQGDGRMVGFGQLHRLTADTFLLAAAPSAFDGILQQLDKLLFREKVELLDDSMQYAVITILSPKVALRTEITELASALKDPAPLAFAWVNGLHAQLIVPQAHLDTAANHLRKRLAEGSEELFTLVRIEQGWPEFGIDCTTSTIPLEARLKHAIDFTKGCFPGQEIVARIENLGHPAKLLSGLTIDGQPETENGQIVRNEEKNVGQISSRAWHPQLNTTIALATLNWKSKDAGTLLTLGTETAPIPARATVTELPFVNRDK